MNIPTALLRTAYQASKSWVVLLCGLLLTAAAASAQQTPVASPLLDRFVGHWVLRYTDHGKRHVHDVTGRWVVQHHYVELYEVSREKFASGLPQYEAHIFITRDVKPKGYVVEWLDNFGGNLPPSTGYAPIAPDRLRFVFRNDAGQVDFINDMTYKAADDTWHWHMDNVEAGKRTLFANMTLTRT